MAEVRHESQEGKASGQVWEAVVESIKGKKWEAANEAKTAVENEQRSMLEAMEEDGEEIELKFFTRDDDKTCGF